MTNPNQSPQLEYAGLSFALDRLADVLNCLRAAAHNAGPETRPDVNRAIELAIATQRATADALARGGLHRPVEPGDNDTPPASRLQFTPRYGKSRNEL